MAELFTELANITESLELDGIEYAVCGGLALSIHGFPRATFDIDILIRSESLERSFEIAKRYGFDIHGLDMSFKDRAVEIRRVSKIDDDGEVLSLDFLLVTPAVDDVWDSRLTIDFQGNPMSIVSREGLIRMKELAGRDKDLIDIHRMQNEKD
ncbi:MAG: hypothetical protein UZ17_ACD001001473 [Acidobacteria bacterium OLB17]|nr:MAG: hypothetical protein UZ17_ACD001001473 [Acidobacteria bacterium OLB17]MCZ2391282.1 hypothetical protein [Acidobacteriota bacterium]